MSDNPLHADKESLTKALFQATLAETIK